MKTPIPGPAGWPFIGNILDVQGQVPIHAIEALTDVYGPIMKLSLGGKDRYFVGGFEIFDELCDETRFWKVPPEALENAGQTTKGLFASPSEKHPDWLQAHRILIPAFGPIAVQGMFDEMHDIATQMVMKWARMGPDQTVLLTQDFTRLTLDTIALCAMGFRFNSFYGDPEKVHPYVEAMTQSLASLSQRHQIGERLKMLLQPSYVAQLKEAREYMQQLGAELVQYRRDHPTDKKDLMNAMIHGTDPKTGESMRDELIAENMQTFLIAGHETTSGLLSFAFMYMLLNPPTFFAAQEEVDRVIGKGRLEPRHLDNLPYLTAVLRETLRLSPTAPGITRGIRPENRSEHVTVAGGKYEIPRGAGILCLLGKIQRDPKVYGEDADEFRPERMLEENFQQLPKNAWKPFGTGLRGCIGRAFAWQEALMVTALVLQNFDVTLKDPGYKMEIQQILTIKPKNTYVRVRLRPGIDATQLLQQLTGTANSSSTQTQRQAPGPSETAPSADGRTETETPPTLTVLHGSNTGTCQSLAQSLAMQASQRGHAVRVADLDSVVERIPTDHPVVVVTASYEGQPPDNAARFVAWLETLQDKEAFRGVSYAVFGCGHKDWPATYQRIPTLVDRLLAEHGGARLAARGESDASQRDMFGDFAKWTDELLWPAMPEAVGSTEKKVHGTEPPTMEVEVSTEQRAAHLQQTLAWATVTDSRRLTAASEPEKRHIEFRLPADMTYRTGDYLVVLPQNHSFDVRRVIRRFQLPWDAVITIKTSGGSGGLASTTAMLPTDVPVPVSDLLRGYVELSLPATRKDVKVLHAVATDADEKARLAALLAGGPSVWAAQIRDTRTSLLDLLEQNPRLPLPLGSFLAMLPPLRTRHYSIASSPLARNTCALCYSVLDAPHCWSDGRRRFRGVAGHYLASLRVGDQALVSVRATNRFFRLPADPATTPLVLFCAGSGLAPFLGFLEERAVQMQQQQQQPGPGKRTLAPALLFVGCRDPDGDRLYAARLDAWVEQGVVDVRYAFSRRPDDPRAAGCCYVVDRLLRDREDVLRLWAMGAKVYTCGSGSVAQSVGAAARKLIREQAQAQGEAKTAEEIDAWLRARHNERFVTDVFA